MEVTGAQFQRPHEQLEGTRVGLMPCVVKELHLLPGALRSLLQRHSALKKKKALSVPSIGFFMLMQRSHGPPQISVQTSEKLLVPGEGRDPSKMHSSCSGVRSGAGRIM